MARLATLVSCLLVTLSLGAREIHSLKEAFNEVEASSWVVLDVDETLIESVQMVGAREWGRHVAQQLSKQGVDPAEAFWKSTEYMMTVHKLIDVAPIEADTPAWIRCLQDQGITVIALTARPGYFIEETRRQLRSVNIDFSLSSPALEDCYFLPGSKPPHYSQGIISTYATAKGTALAAFMQLTSATPSAIIFIDDCWENTRSVAEAMATLGIPCHTFRYAAGDAKRAAFDPKVADLQWTCLNKVLSDEQAKMLLRRSN